MTYNRGKGYVCIVGYHRHASAILQYVSQRTLTMAHHKLDLNYMLFAINKIMEPIKSITLEIFQAKYAFFGILFQGVSTKNLFCLFFFKTCVVLPTNKRLVKHTQTDFECICIDLNETELQSFLICQIVKLYSHVVSSISYFICSIYVLTCEEISFFHFFSFQNQIEEMNISEVVESEDGYCLKNQRIFFVKFDCLKIQQFL